MDYIGEQLLPGQLGHFFIILSLVASLVATFAYFKASTETNKLVATNSGTLLSGVSNFSYWKKLARIAFVVESISIVSVFVCLFYIIHNHRFEYNYAWDHSNRALEFKYLFACFWEGQEGSFLLWSFWHCVLGLIVMKTSKKWEAPVMTVISLTQFCLATMVAGIYFFGWKMGTNPFLLLRETGMFDNAPAMHLNFDVNQPLKPDYMTAIKDGDGLNQLLQNYWMVIHPPILFLGFATTLIPFAFAVAGLWKKEYGNWVKPALPWALFSAAALGVGIMLGAMWAYESLTFGGYWAWDPVENASLVPWLILISGIHTMLIYKHTGYSLRASLIFMILSFGFVLYSTFLTRTGILGDTSVHAFTGEGSNFFVHILLLLAVLLLPAFYLYIKRYREVPAIVKEEAASSREFWMFIGSLVFFLSAMVVTAITSLPVFNKIFGTKLAPPENVEFLYNSIHVYVAIILAVLTAITQYLKYKETPAKYFWKKILTPTLIAVVIAGLVLGFGEVNYKKETVGFMASIWIAVACSIYTVVANAGYIWAGLKGKLKLAGGSVAHVGFGLVLLGILISSAKKEILTHNIGGIPAPVGEGEDPKENLTLVQGMPVNMGKYELTYIKDSAHPKKVQSYYKILFKAKDGKEKFILEPNSFINPNGLNSNPSFHRYWSHDIFTYITSISNPDKTKDTASFKPNRLRPGDSLFYSSGFMILQDVKEKKDIPDSLFGKDGKLYEAPVKIFSKTGSIYTVTPRLAVAKGEQMAIADTIHSESLVLQLQQVNPDNTIELGVKESGAVMKYITIKAYKFPFINILWLGVAITAIGILMSMVQRIRLNRRQPARSED